MSKFIALFVFLFSVPAFASQSIVCREVNKDGSIRAKGGKVHLSIGLTKAGKVSYRNTKVKVTGFEKKGSTHLSELTVISVGEGETVVGKKPFTTVFIDNNGYLDIQLQFDQHIVNQSFRNVKADFVIGSDDANPENYFAFGYDVSCSSRL